MIWCHVNSPTQVYSTFAVWLKLRHGYAHCQVVQHATCSRCISGCQPALTKARPLALVLARMLWKLAYVGVCMCSAPVCTSTAAQFCPAHVPRGVRVSLECNWLDKAQAVWIRLAELCEPDTSTTSSDRRCRCGGGCMPKGKSWVAVPMYLPHGEIGSIILGPVLGPVSNGVSMSLYPWCFWSK